MFIVYLRQRGSETGDDAAGDALGEDGVGSEEGLVGVDEALQAPVAGTERNTGHGHDAGLSEDTAAAGLPVLPALCSLCTSAPHPRNLQIRLWKSQVELERAFFQQSNCVNVTNSGFISLKIS